MKPIEKTYSTLYDYCRWGKPEKVKNLLDGILEKIDLTYQEGLFFQLATTEKTPETLNTLIEYYDKTQLQGNPNFPDHKLAKSKLLKILQEAVDSYPVSPAMQEVIDKYLPKKEGSDIDDLKEVELAFDDNDSTSSHSKGEESEGSTLSHDSAASNGQKYEVLTEDSLRRLALIDQEDPSEGVHLSGENVELIDNH